MPEENIKYLVVKLGTQIVIEEGKPVIPRLEGIAHEILDLRKNGAQVILVSSGAVGLGRAQLNLWAPSLTTTEKQACAAVGQSLLMNLYRDIFGSETIAQVLLTHDDFSDRRRYLSIKNTLEHLLNLNVIPIINENDVVSAKELLEVEKSFGDNDKLSALVSGLINADQLIILTNVDAVYTANPGSDPNAKRIEKVERLEQLSVIDTSGQSSLGRGGMSTKITAAKIAAFCGVQTSISSGLIDRPITSALKQSGGTHVQPQLAMSGKKRWIGFSSGYQGVITVNTFAVKALAEQKASLLAVGIVNATGEFSEGEIVSICDPEGNEIGRGIANFNLESVNKVIGKHSSEVGKILGKDLPPEVIHRDNLVIYSEHEA